ncbi:hypothetical protein Q3G72_019795 [Acer saccharum]|nr:hypothetical protein Q3G72_019795 [Acer saccharum]
MHKRQPIQAHHRNPDISLAPSLESLILDGQTSDGHAIANHEVVDGGGNGDEQREDEMDSDCELIKEDEMDGNY